MDRPAFIGTVAGGLLTAPLAAEGGQEAGKVWRIGWLLTGSLESHETRLLRDAFREGLRERGYIEGQNIVIEYRPADGRIERFPRLASELVRLNLDLIVAANTPAARAAQQATTTIPIVVPMMGDPVGDGLVTSLAQPGDNLAEVANVSLRLYEKRIEILKADLPKLRRLATLAGPSIRSDAIVKAVKEAVRVQGIQGVPPRFLTDPAELKGAFADAIKARADAVVITPNPFFNAHRDRVIALAARYRLPALYEFRDFVEAGGLMCYGADNKAIYRRVATYVDRILKGEKPADLPVEEPTKVELVINLKTSKALGLTIPPSLLTRADQVIE